MSLLILVILMEDTRYHTCSHQHQTINHWYVIAPQLAFIQCIKIFFTWDMIYAVYFTSFCIFYPQNYLGYFFQGRFHSGTTQIFLWREDITLEMLLGFENLQIVAHGFLGCQFLGKYRIFHFDQFLMHQKKVSGYFAVAAYVIPRHISRCTVRIYIVLYGYKVFLTSYAGLKISKKVKFLQFLHFFYF